MKPIGSIMLGLCLLLTGWSVSAQTRQTPPDKDKLVVLDFEELTYPPLARYAHLQGVAVVQVKLDDKGAVTEAMAISGAKPLALAAVDNVKKWHFEPSVRKSAVIVYNFTIIEGRCNDRAGLFVLRENDLAEVIACPANPNE